MITVDDIAFHGSGLSRPECALAHKSGLLFAPCCKGDGGVSVITPLGKTVHILATDVSAPLKPNGIALEPGGSFLLAHLGRQRGAIVRLFADGKTELVTETADGKQMPPANFVTYDRQGRIWITVSTRIIPRTEDYRKNASTGFVALHEGGETRIVADGLGYTNEIAFSADQSTAWVNETFGRRTLAFAVDQDGGLSDKSTLARYSAGTFPDGLTPDIEGGVWITSIISNRVLRVTNAGIEKILEDSDPSHLAKIETVFAEDSLGRLHLEQARSKKLQNISNLAFGGPDLKTAYLGCLLGDQIASFQSPIAGLPPPHWEAELGPLAEYLETP